MLADIIKITNIRIKATVFEKNQQTSYHYINWIIQSNQAKPLTQKLPSE
ncbi:MAG: hypothetical protein KAJ63_13710 [Methyloprofundus sp.]|nr:hypothetical protein [Methyloprofundus sp.]